MGLAVGISVYERGVFYFWRVEGGLSFGDNDFPISGVETCLPRLDMEFDLSLTDSAGDRGGDSFHGDV